MYVQTVTCFKEFYISRNVVEVVVVVVVVVVAATTAAVIKEIM